MGMGYTHRQVSAKDFKGWGSDDDEPIFVIVES